MGLAVPLFPTQCNTRKWGERGNQQHDGLFLLFWFSFWVLTVEVILLEFKS
jgi:hypothetical protein